MHGTVGSWDETTSIFVLQSNRKKYTTTMLQQAKSALLLRVSPACGIRVGDGPACGDRHIRQQLSLALQLSALPLVS